MRIKGFNSASILTRRVDQGTEFLIVTVGRLNRLYRGFS
jgi:hypothetical protein